MPTKISPEAKDKSKFVMHVAIFIIANAALWAYWYFVQGANHQWVYPWGIWITAAWGLTLVGHWASVYSNFKDAGNDEYLRQKKS